MSWDRNKKLQREFKPFAASFSANTRSPGGARFLRMPVAAAKQAVASSKEDKVEQTTSEFGLQKVFSRKVFQQKHQTGSGANWRRTLKLSDQLLTREMDGELGGSTRSRSTGHRRGKPGECDSSVSPDCTDDPRYSRPCEWTNADDFPV